MPKTQQKPKAKKQSTKLEEMYENSTKEITLKISRKNNAKNHSTKNCKINICMPQNQQKNKGNLKSIFKNLEFSNV